jgi:hypothetical protein
MEEAIMKKTTIGVLRDGAIGGFIAYGLISVYFALLNVLAGKSPWSTLEALSTGLFAGTDPGQMIAFNGVHLIVFIVLGIIAAWMIQEVELHPAFWYVVFFISIVGFMLGYVLLSLVAATLANLSPLTVAIGNVFAAIGMGCFLFWRHPQMARAVRDELERDEHEHEYQLT